MLWALAGGLKDAPQSCECILKATGTFGVPNSVLTDVSWEKTKLT